MDDDIILQKLRASGAPASLCKQLLTIWCRGFREQNENLGSIVFLRETTLLEQSHWGLCFLREETLLNYVECRGYYLELELERLRSTCAVMSRKTELFWIRRVLLS